VCYNASKSDRGHHQRGVYRERERERERGRGREGGEEEEDREEPARSARAE